MNKSIKVAIVGQPNVGKSSIINSMGNASLHVGNFTGVTVEKKEVFLKRDLYDIKMTDLPGIYSLNAYTPEEQVAKNFLLHEEYDIILNVVDANTLSRNLIFTLQLLDMHKKTILVLNMIDEVEKKSHFLNKESLETLLGIPVILTSAKENRGVEEITTQIIALSKKELIKNKVFYDERIEQRIENLAKILRKSPHFKDYDYSRFLAIRLLDRDESVYKMIHDMPIFIEAHNALEKMYKNLENEFDEESTIDIFSNQRAAIAYDLQRQTLSLDDDEVSLSEKIDNILIHPILGLPIFLFFMWALFQLTFELGNIPMNLIDSAFSQTANFLAGFLPQGIFNSILTEGILPAVGAVVMFLPNILILFFGLNLLEQTGYMSRAAYLMDGFLKRFGLQGKAFIPLVSGFGCTVPAYMAARTLKNPKDRIITMLVLGFMSCGARLPIYVLIIAAFFSNYNPGNILFYIYIGGALLGLIVAKVLRVVLFKGEPEPFVMEMPPYRFPSGKALFMDLWNKTRMFLKKAGTFIALASMVVWFLSSYPKNMELSQSYNQKIEMTQNLESKKALINTLNAKLLEGSFLGQVGKFIEPVFKPLGFDWRMSVSVIAGLAAKEVVVSTMGTLYAVGGAGEANQGLIQKMQENVDFKAAFALIIIVMIYSPCLAAMSTFYAEVPQWAWRTFYTIYPNVVAWLLAYASYKILSLMGY
ncbi:ferrous iron transport protein B [Sulfurospirillum sp. 1612]|uniref:ferrous iron transport protein B n=1 Tax=Sulfurospirillum sp. 1612 TaxID=3094835 RepID=UPI002F91DD7B